MRAYFFDMDGVLFDSMPNHAIAWEEVMKQHQLPFTAYDCYLNEGRTGESVIREAMWKARNRDARGDCNYLRREICLFHYVGAESWWYTHYSRSG